MKRRLRRIFRARPRARRINPADEPTAQRLGSLLWAGFETSALADLTRLRDDVASSPSERAGAAYQLACWHLAQGQAELAASELSAVRSLATDKVVVLEHLALEVDVLVELGQKRRAARRLTDGLNAQPTNAHLQLRRANVDPRKWLDSMNLVLARDDLAPIRFADPGRGAALDNLISTPGEVLEGPLISVVMPAYRAAPTVEMALRSLLAQTWTSLEVLVVDDASPDATAEVICDVVRQDPRVRLLRHPENRGAYAARNTGLAAARGAFVTVHDADDWSHPQKIARQVIDLAEHPERLGNFTHLVSADEHLRFRHHGRHPYRLVRKNASSLMLRREVFDVVGPWDDVRVSADSELLHRVEARFGSGAIAPLGPSTPLAIARKSATSLTGDSPAGIRSLWHVQGARRQYHDAFIAWHQNVRFNESLPLQPAVAPRPFACPQLVAGRASDPAEHLDIVVLSDFALDPPAPSAAEIAALVAAGHRVGLLHHPVYELGAERSVDGATLAMAANGNPRFLSTGERVSCRLLVVRVAACLDHRIDHPAIVDAEVTTEVGTPDGWPDALLLLT
jgi:hypothetical protein